MKIKKIVASMLFMGLCVVSQAQTNKSSRTESDPDNLAKEYFSQIMGVAVSATKNTKLYQFIYEWIGTPYRLGGDSKNGIDCSKFSYELYDKVFNTSLGYNSRNQYSQIKSVKKDDLKAGDLVFFKIRSSRITHVGVYIGDNKFAHASSSKGVMISNLNEPYWRRYYYDGGHLPEDKIPEAKKLLAELPSLELGKMN